MTVLHPRHTMTFRVTGANEAELYGAAAAMLRKFALDPEQWDYVLRAEPAVGTMDGEVEIWQAEVEAWRTK